MPPSARRRSWRRLEHRVVEVLRADELACVHVDDGERLGLVDDEICARIEPDLAVLKLLYLVFEAVELEERRPRRAYVDLGDVLMEEFLYDRFDVLALVLAVDDYFVHFVRQLVAQHALEQADVLVYEARRAVLLHPVLNLAPLGDEVFNVAAQALRVAVFRDGPDDYAEALGPYLLRHGAQARALFVAGYALRNARLVPAGNQHHVAPR